MAKQLLRVLLVHGCAALAIGTVVPIGAAQALLDVTEHAVAEGEFAPIEIALRAQPDGGLLAKVLPGERDRDSPFVGTHAAVAEHARCGRVQHGLLPGQGRYGGDGHQKKKQRKRSFHGKGIVWPADQQEPLARKILDYKDMLWSLSREGLDFFSRSNWRTCRSATSGSNRTFARSAMTAS